MAVERHQYSDTAVITALSANLTDSASTASIEEDAGWPDGTTGTFRVRIDEGLSNEEIIKCNGLTGGTLAIVTRGDCRTAAAAHGIGAQVEHVFTGTDADESNAHASDITRDDHTQYVHNDDARTISADHNFTGDPTFSGTPVFSGGMTVAGSPHFTGNPIVDHPTSLRDTILPAGIWIPYGGTDPPPGWLICDGSAVSRTTYHDLFFAIGGRFGNGDGVTTFNVPNMAGRVAVGSGDIGHAFAASGTFATDGTSMGWLAANYIIKAS